MSYNDLYCRLPPALQTKPELTSIFWFPKTSIKNWKIRLG